MVMRGQAWPAAGGGGVDAVHGQPVLAGGAGGSWSSETKLMRVGAEQLASRPRSSSAAASAPTAKRVDAPKCPGTSEGIARIARPDQTAGVHPAPRYRINAATMPDCLTAS